VAEQGRKLRGGTWMVRLWDWLLDLGDTVMSWVPREKSTDERRWVRRLDGWLSLAALITLIWFIGWCLWKTWTVGFYV
jgi:hypothetical protein